MEEQRQRQEDEARRAAVVSAAEAGVSSSAADGESHVHHLYFYLKCQFVPIFLQYDTHFFPLCCRV